MLKIVIAEVTLLADNR